MKTLNCFDSDVKIKFKDAKIKMFPMPTLETSMERMEPPGPETNEFENRVKKKQFLGFSEYQVSDAKINISGVLFEKFFTSVKILIENFRDEVEQVVSGKFQFENREESKTLTLRKIFGLSEFLRKAQSYRFLNGVFLCR